MARTSKAEIKKALSETTTVQVRGKDVSMVQKRMSMPGAKDAFVSALKYSTTARRINIDKIKSPTFVIWGKEDHVIPVRFVLPFLKMKNCRLYLLENCGHRPHVEKPILINEIIKGFIEDNEENLFLDPFPLHIRGKELYIMAFRLFFWYCQSAIN